MILLVVSGNPIPKNTSSLLITNNAVCCHMQHTSTKLLLPILAIFFPLTPGHACLPSSDTLGAGFFLPTTIGPRFEDQLGFPDSQDCGVKKWPLQARGQGGQFGMNGQGSTVAASPVADHVAQNSRGRPLAHPLAPMVEMLVVMVCTSNICIALSYASCPK